LGKGRRGVGEKGREGRKGRERGTSRFFTWIDAAVVNVNTQLTPCIRACGREKL